MAKYYLCISYARIHRTPNDGNEHRTQSIKANKKYRRLHKKTKYDIFHSFGSVRSGDMETSVLSMSLFVKYKPKVPLKINSFQ